MRKFTLFLASLFCAIGAVAQITAISDLNNESVYTIKSVNRGFLYYDANNGDYVTSSSHTNLTDATPEGLENELFAFLRVEGMDENCFYIYSWGAKKFVTYTGTNGVALELTETPASQWEVNENTGCFVIKVPGTEKTYINITNWQAKFGSKVTSTDPDEGNRMTIVNCGEQDLADAINLLPEAIEKINEAKDLIVDAVGYPAKTSAAYQALSNLSDYTQLETAVANYYACTDIQLPEDGKAYKIKAWWKTDGEWPMTFSTDVYKPTQGAEGDVLVCRKVGDNYIFVGNNGYYLGWSDGGSVNCTRNDYASNLQFVVERATTSRNGGDVASDLTESDLFGKLCIKSAENVKDRGKQYIMFSSGDRNYHNGSAGSKYYGHTNANTVFFTFEDATYENVVDLKDATGVMNADGVAGLATFSAPFATVVPEGVTAYYAVAQENVDYVSMTAVAEGEAIPANAGVILAGELGKVTMVPAATETKAALEGNILGHSAGEAKVMSAGYVLGKVDDVLAFYPVEVGTTLGKNKAYLNLTNGASVMRMNFGGNTTGIGAVENTTNANAPIFDLAGRRVNSVVKGGLYIQNGKKFIVK